MFTTFIIMFLTSFLVSLCISPLVIRAYILKGWVDDPKKNPHAKVTHSQPVPRGGGIVIFLTVLCVSIFLLQWDGYLSAILVGAAILTLIGWWDDIANIHPAIRLFAGLVAALVVVGSGIGIAYISNPAGGVIELNHPQISFTDPWGEVRSIWILADIFALFFIIWNMNIVNWSKGVDGQLPGFVSIALVFVGIIGGQYAADPTQFDTSSFSWIIAGAYAGLLFWNWYPQKIMPGYGAGSLAGYFLAVLAIVSGAKVAATLMVLAIPTADAIFAITRRLWAGKSPLWGDRGHLHHKLLDVFGWGRRRIAVFYWSTSLVLGILSLYLNTVGKVITISISALLVVGVLVWAKFVEKSRLHRKITKT